MAISLKKSFFKRNRQREYELGSIFHKTSSNLNFFMGLIITIFFTPAIVVTSFLSKEILLILINVSLSLGYLVNYGYKCYRGEVSRLDMLLTVAFLAASLALAYFLFPPLGALSLLSTLVFINQMAIAVNLFFSFKNVIVPPCMKLIKNIGYWLGLEFSDRYFVKRDLNMKTDRFVIDTLLRKAYEHDSTSTEFNLEKIKPFNKMITVLSDYINKYDTPIMGYINNRSAISDLEKMVDNIVTNGQTDSALSFINRKINFKQTKLGMLRQVRQEFEGLEGNNEDPSAAAAQYLTGVNREQLHGTNRAGFFTHAIATIDTEIRRQEEKIHLLEACKP